MSKPEARTRNTRELPEIELPEEIAGEFTTEELLEFLEADQRPDQADPVFRERLREELWQLVRRGRLQRSR